MSSRIVVGTFSIDVGTCEANATRVFRFYDMVVVFTQEEQNLMFLVGVLTPYRHMLEAR